MPRVKANLVKSEVSVISPSKVEIPTPQYDIPSEEIFIQMGVNPENFGDFMLAYQITILQTQGMSLSKACDKTGVARSSIYEQKWQDLLLKAQRHLLSMQTTSIRSSLNIVYDQWGAIIANLVRIARFSTEDKDQIAAAQTLFDMFPSLRIEPTQDTKSERDYLSRPHNFEPLSSVLAIQAQAGSTINVNQNKDSVLEVIEVQESVIGE